MESYEQKYKAALEWMRFYYPSLEGAAREDAEHYFPELAESEDERIRKEIIHHILYKANGVSEEQEHSWVAYLEKQKEQKAEQSEMEKEYVRTLHSLIADFLRGKQEIDREYYQKIWDWLDNRHIEQKDIKLLSWRAVDECKDIPDGHYVVVAYNRPGFFALDTVVKGKLSHPNRGDIKATGVFYIPNANEKCIYLEKQKINTEGDFARGYDCGYECCLNSHGAEWSEKQKEQKPAEWSEEDERRFISCMGKLQTADGAPTINSNWFEEHCYKHPSWKPSEMQMNALKNIAYGSYQIGDGPVLRELYDNLKKL